MTSEIHFYSRTSLLPEILNEDARVCYSYFHTQKVLDHIDDWEQIHTIQMCFLADMGRFMAKGIKVIIHDSTGDYEIKLGGDNERTIRELHEGHNFFKLWENGDFIQGVE